MMPLYFQIFFLLQCLQIQALTLSCGFALNTLSPPLGGTQSQPSWHPTLACGLGSQSLCWFVNYTGQQVLIRNEVTDTHRDDSAQLRDGSVGPGVIRVPAAIFCFRQLLTLMSLTDVILSLPGMAMTRDHRQALTVDNEDTRCLKALVSFPSYR